MDEFQTRTPDIGGDEPESGLGVESGGGEVRQPRLSKFINLKPAANLHHAVRIAEAKKLPLNLFLSIHFSFTECSASEVGKAFQRLRDQFGKWVSRPPKRSAYKAVPPTCVWVLERPNDGHVHCHWQVHVPKPRQEEFRNRLPMWIRRVAGNISDEKAAIDIKPVKTARGAAKYMLKGMQPGMASYFDIRHEPQGTIEGRRSGFSKNLGPTQKNRLRGLGKYPPAKRWVKNLYGKTA